MAASSAEPEDVEIVLKSLVRVVLRSHLAVRDAAPGGHGDDEVINGRRASHHRRPPASAPRIENRRQYGMDRHVTTRRGLGLKLVVGAPNHEASQREARGVVVQPLQTRCLSVPKTGDALEAVDHPAISRNTRVENEGHQLASREDCAVSPVWVSVYRFAELVSGQDARRSLE